VHINLPAPVDIMAPAKGTKVLKQAPKKVAKAVKKAPVAIKKAPAAIKKAPAAIKKAVSGGSKGWLGGTGGAQGLDKWYGELFAQQSRLSVNRTAAAAPSRGKSHAVCLVRARRLPASSTVPSQSGESH
jgi:hypothetical protein